ncbi:PAS domain-containing sensor histidine kinase [Cytobacillus sp. FJAT-54145]|uniref:PAS domain-containing sensor histidine kinase n=1 Tax=Cytobacillus spartinae TaxID=3299023 RepID=A0ABW6K8H4_9BACI
MELEETYRQIFKLMLNETTVMLYIVNRDRHMVFSTPNMSEISGYSLEELRGMDTFTMVHPDDLEHLKQRHMNLLASQTNNSTEFRIVNKNGDVRYVECKTTPLPDTEDYLQVVSTRDNSERKLMEMELERQKSRYEVLQNSLKNFSQDLTAVMKLADLEERLLKEVKTILPESKPKLLLICTGETEEFAESRPNIDELSIGKIVTTNDQLLIKIGEYQNNVYVLSVSAGDIKEEMESIWLETLSFYTVMVMDNLNVIANLIDELDSALKKTETPQWVLRLLFNLQEQQRLTLSSDLHDTVLQEQIYLYRKMESLINRYDFGSEDKSKLIEIEQGLLDNIHQLRMTCNELRPPLLRELGLERALENLFEHIQVSSTYKIIFTSKMIPSVPLDEEQTIGIYRIVQELLKNADSHSKASLIHFDIHFEDALFKMVYNDNGVGFGQDSLKPSFNKLGLTSITQRAKSLGGNFEFLSEPGNGLKASLEVPITKERSQL